MLLILLRTYYVQDTVLGLSVMILSVESLLKMKVLFLVLAMTDKIWVLSARRTE